MQKKVLCLLATFTVLCSMALVPGIALAKSKVSMISWIDETQMGSILDAFHKEHPEIEVDFSFKASGDLYRDQIFVWALAGVLPDIVQVPGQGGNLNELVRQGAFLDLTARVERDLDHSDMLPTSFLPNIHVFDGRYYGMPAVANLAEILFVLNREYFSHSGVALPELEWTWDQFVNIGKKLTRTPSGSDTPDIWGVMFPHMQRYPVWLYSGGAEIFDHPTRPTRTLIDQPEAIHAMEWLADLNLVHRIAVNGDIAGKTRVRNLFLTGRAGMGLYSYMWATSNYRQGTFTFDWSLAKMPAGPGGSVSLNSDNPWVISSQSKEADAAWTYLKWRLSAPAQQLAMQINQGWGPLLRSIIVRSNWLNPSKPPYDMVPAVFHDVRTMFSFQGATEIDGLLLGGITKVWAGQKSARQVVAELAPRINAQLAELHPIRNGGN